MATMTFDTRTIQDAMAWVINHVDNAPSHLGDTALLISAPKDGHVVLAGGRDQSSARARVPFQGTAPEKETAIHAHMFNSIVKNAPGKTVELNFQEAGVLIKSGSAKSKVTFLSATEATAARAANQTPRQVRADVSELTDVVTSLATIPDDKDVSRPAIAGLKVKYSKGLMTMAATDRYLLGENKLSMHVPDEHPNPEELTLDVLVPNHVLQSIVRVLPENEPVWFHWDDNTKRLAMSTSNYWTSFGLLGANSGFPSGYEAAMNVQDDTVITVDRKAFTAVLSRAGQALSKDASIFGLIALTEDDRAGEITVKATGAYTHEEELPAEVHGQTIDPLKVGSSYLLRAVKAAKGDNLTLTIGANRIKVVSDHSEHAQFVFMGVQDSQ